MRHGNVLTSLPIAGSSATPWASLETSFGTLPPRVDSSLLLVELLVRNGEFERALATFKTRLLST